MQLGRLLPLILLFAAGLASEPALAAYEAEAPEAKSALQLQGRMQISGLPGFEFELQPDGEPLIVLGVNAFTPQQLLQFVVALPDFLEGASALTEGQSLVLRQFGEQGYVSLSAHYAEPMNRFTLTFQAEAPASVANVAAVRGLGFNLAEMLLTRE